VRDLEELIRRVSAQGSGGLLALRVADTLKQARAAAAGAGFVVAETVDRADLWRALTPQMFRFGALCAALDAAHSAGRHPSDEAQALEWRGENPLLVEGAATNLKLTTGADLALAEAVLRARR
jgi:2-C-methyl-D-erythritol 4-phosphate cytidylyltransferase